MMKKAALLAALPVAALAMGAAAPSCSAPPPGRTVHVPGGTRYLRVTENDIHGDLTLFRADYQDGYVHGTIVPAGNGPVRDLEHFTCINPEVPGHPPCAASRGANDQMLTNDPEDLGTLGQPHTGVNHNVLADFHASGRGPTLRWRTFEHGPHEGFYFTFADGFTLHVIVDHPIHYYDLQLVTQRTTATSITHAVQTTADEDTA
jgi:hypothetical protein